VRTIQRHAVGARQPLDEIHCLLLINGVYPPLVQEVGYRALVFGEHEALPLKVEAILDGAAVANPDAVRFVRAGVHLRSGGHEAPVDEGTGRKVADLGFNDPSVPVVVHSSHSSSDCTHSPSCSDSPPAAPLSRLRKRSRRAAGNPAEEAQ